MGLFKPKGLGATYRCARCHEKYYEIKQDQPTFSEANGYAHKTLYKCKKCNKYMCDACLGLGGFGGGTFMKCVCGAQEFDRLPVLWKL